MRWMRWMLAVGLLHSLQAVAVIESYEFDDEELLTRYQVLSAELRCPKCQNQNIADSNAPIAQDLRSQLHRQLHEGKSDDEIVDYMVKRYGEFVMYRPRWNAVTMVLWLAPAIFLELALWVLVASLRRGRAEAAEPASLSPQEQARLDALLEGDTTRD